MKGKHLFDLKAHLQVFSTEEVCRRLGISSSTWRRFIADPERDLPREIGLAAAALAAGLEPYEPRNTPIEQIYHFGGDAARKHYPVIKNW
jgi:hypothetical protein